MVIVQGFIPFLLEQTNIYLLVYSLLQDNYGKERALVAGDEETKSMLVVSVTMWGERAVAEEARGNGSVRPESIRRGWQW